MNGFRALRIGDGETSLRQPDQTPQVAGESPEAGHDIVSVAQTEIPSPSAEDVTIDASLELALEDLASDLPAGQKES
jgi:hypothetical protein